MTKNFVYAVQNTTTGKHWLLACRGDYQRDFEQIKERDKNGTLFEPAKTKGKDIFRGNPDELEAVVIEEVSDGNTLRERSRYWSSRFREVVETVRARIREDSNRHGLSGAIAQPVREAGHDPISRFLQAAKELRELCAIDTRKFKLNADLEFVLINGMDFDAGRRLFENLAVRRNWYVEELWDVVSIATYPSRQAMVEMIQSEKYQEIHVHRDAGLAGQLNIETTGAGGAWLST